MILAQQTAFILEAEELEALIIFGITGAVVIIILAVLMVFCRRMARRGGVGGFVFRLLQIIFLVALLGSAVGAGFGVVAVYIDPDLVKLSRVAAEEAQVENKGQEVASAPPDEEKQMEMALKSDADFTIDPAEGFRLVEADWNRIKYIEQSEEAEGEAAPVFTVERQRGMPPNINPRDFAEEQFKYMSGYFRKEIERQARPVSINGLQGFELEGSARQSNPNRSVAIFMVVLYDERAYYVMQGIVREEAIGRYRMTFKDMANSFKRRTR